MQNNNIVGGNTTVFKYDKGGNLQYKKVYVYSAAVGKTYTDLLNGTGKTISYGYDVTTNKDLLTSYNGSGTLEYNGYGNPEKWFKHGTNGSSLAYTLQWGLVSNLITITDDDTQDIYTYIYNNQGIRTEKIINDVSHKYYLQGEQIIAERYGNKLIKFYYDGTGVCGFNYNGTDYYYQKNIQGDILKIFNGNGTLYAEYSYDAWGKCSIKTNVNGIAKINPFRYRGYYLDDETGLYYLNSRYYDPEVGRFISPDSVDYLAPESINGLNLYAYCLNNPVMHTDPSGNSFLIPFLVAMLVGGLVKGVIAAVNTANDGGTFKEISASFVGNFITGAAIGGAMVLGGIAAVGGYGVLATIGLGAAAVGISFIGGIGSYYASNAILGNELNFSEALPQGAVTAFAGLNAFGAGYLMGISGFYNNLLKEKYFTSFIRSARDIGLKGVDAFAHGALSYLEKNVMAMGVRALIKMLFTYPYLNAIQN